eukprot:UN11074
MSQKDKLLKLYNNITNNYKTDCYIRYCDVTNKNDVESYVQNVLNKYNKIDVLFNNAGIQGEFESSSDMTGKNFRNVTDVNLYGVFLNLKICQ